MTGSFKGRLIAILYLVTLLVAGAVCWIGATIVEDEVENRLVHDAAANVGRVMGGMKLSPTEGVLNRLAEIVDGEILVTDEDGQIVGSSSHAQKVRLPDGGLNLGPTESASLTIETTRYVVGASTVTLARTESPHVLLVLIPEERIANARQSTTNRLIGWTVLVVAVATVIILIASSGVTAALRRLTNDLDSMSRRVSAEGVKGLTGAELNNRGPEETQRLSEAFQRLVVSLEDAERKMAKLEELAAIGKVTASVIHEIRNPLSGIQMHLRLLQDEDFKNSEVDESLDIISREVRRLDLYVDELVVLAKSGTPSSSDQELVAVDIQEELTYTLKLLEGKISHAGVNLTNEINNDLPEVWADPIRIRQVFMNILINALEATPPGGTVEITSTDNDDTVLLAFTDSGGGISADSTTIFDAFVTTKAHGGGLGLYICSQIMTSFGGKIRGFNRNEGACFELELRKYENE